MSFRGLVSLGSRRSATARSSRQYLDRSGRSRLVLVTRAPSGRSQRCCSAFRDTQDCATRSREGSGPAWVMPQLRNPAFGSWRGGTSS